MFNDVEDISAGLKGMIQKMQIDNFPRVASGLLVG